ncbi:MAG: GNAT family N-acetyltransferase [Gemmatimonadota bacterium]|nr:MAG: GNAT family N-acetyltransferase [Gemmatimonadota bacterium]
MTGIPTLSTNRLILRPFNLNDAARVRELAGDREVAATTANIPHPYEEGMAEEWIAGHAGSFESGKTVTLAIVLEPEELIGAVGLVLNELHRSAELGYWIGKPYWNQGYCTEAAQEMVRYGFEVLGLNRIQARYMTKNPASGRVMEKLGMSHEGVLRQSLTRFGTFEDAAMYSILHDEYREK